MRQFYLGKNSSGYYKVYFINPVTGLRDNGKSTHTKDKIEAIVIASSWLENGVPQARGNSRAFMNSKNNTVPLNLKNFVNSLDDSDLQTVYELVNKKLNKDSVQSLFIPKTENLEPIEKKCSKDTLTDSGLKLCSTLFDFWDFDKSVFIQRYIAHGHSMSKKHTIQMQAFVRNNWLPYFGEDKCIEDLTKIELDDFFFYLHSEYSLENQ